MEHLVLPRLSRSSTLLLSFFSLCVALVCFAFLMFCDVFRCGRRCPFGVVILCIVGVPRRVSRQLCMPQGDSVGHVNRPFVETMSFCVVSSAKPRVQVQDFLYLSLAVKPKSKPALALSNCRTPNEEFREYSFGAANDIVGNAPIPCLLYTSPSPRD